MEAIYSSQQTVFTKSTRRRITEDGILHSHRRENLKSYTYAISLLSLIYLFIYLSPNLERFPYFK
jgi:hypothetical protein